MELNNNKVIEDYIKELEQTRDTYINNTPTKDRKVDYEFLKKRFKDEVSDKGFGLLGLSDYERVLKIIGLSYEENEYALKKFDYFTYPFKKEEDPEATEFFKNVLIAKITDYLTTYEETAALENETVTGQVGLFNKYINIFKRNDFSEFDLDEFLTLLSNNGVLKEDRIILLNYVNRQIKDIELINLRNKIIKIVDEYLNDEPYGPLKREIQTSLSNGIDVNELPYEVLANKYQVDQSRVQKITYAILVDSFFDRYIQTEDTKYMNKANEYLSKVDDNPVIAYAEMIIEANRIVEAIPEKDAYGYSLYSLEEIMEHEQIGLEFAKKVKLSSYVQVIKKKLLEYKTYAREESFQELKNVIEKYDERLDRLAEEAKHITEYTR